MTRCRPWSFPVAKKPSTKPAPADQAAPPLAAEGATGLSTAAEGDVGPIITLSSSLGAGLAHSAPVHHLGGLPPLAVEPVIPPELDAELNNRERRIVWLMVNGASYAEALRNTARTSDGAPRSQERTDAIPPPVIAAVAAIFQQVAARAGLNRGWLIAQTVALLERASSAVPVLDRKGLPTGEYRFDGPTAANCLKMLAEWNGELYPKKGGLIPVSDVAQLLAAVAGRGRPTLDARRMRLVGTGTTAPDAAPQQPPKAA